MAANGTFDISYDLVFDAKAADFAVLGAARYRP